MKFKEPGDLIKINESVKIVMACLKFKGKNGPIVAVSTERFRATHLFIFAPCTSGLVTSIRMGNIESLINPVPCSMFRGKRRFDSFKHDGARRLYLDLSDELKIVTPTVDPNVVVSISVDRGELDAEMWGFQVERSGD